MTKSGTPEVARLAPATRAARSPGTESPSNKTPPIPWAITGAKPFTSKSRDGITTNWAARRARGHLDTTSALLHACEGVTPPPATLGTVEPEAEGEIGWDVTGPCTPRAEEPQ